MRLRFGHAAWGRHSANSHLGRPRIRRGEASGSVKGTTCGIGLNSLLTLTVEGLRRGDIDRERFSELASLVGLTDSEQQALLGRETE